MAYRIQYEGNNEIGVFTKLTNKYCLVGTGANSNYFSTMESELGELIPIVSTTIGGTRIVGRVCLGNKNGLLVPSITTDQELQHLRNTLPDDVKLQRVEEKLSALGNIVACNDYIALVHPELDINTKEIIEDVLKVETIPGILKNQSLLGSYSVFNNKGGLISENMTLEEMRELSTMVQVPLMISTVNRGSSLLGAGLIVNDWIGFTGLSTTSTELSVIEKIFGLKEAGFVENNALLDTLA